MKVQMGENQVVGTLPSMVGFTLGGGADGFVSAMGVVD